MMIAEFRGPYRWLSNFEPCRVKLDEPWDYISTEHAYMSLKSFDPAWKITCRDAPTPKEFRALGQEVPLRPDWEAVKIECMNRVLKLKFVQEPFRSRLLATGSAHLQEGNRYHDKFWGVDLDTGEGANNLGRLIMAIRYGLRSADIDLTKGL